MSDDDFEVWPCPICKAEVITSVSVAARRVIVNAAPTAGGDVVLEWRGGVDPLSRKTTPAGGRLLRTLHTCDIAGRGRRL